MKLGDFYDQLCDYVLKMDEAGLRWRHLDVEVPLHQASIGHSAGASVKDMYQGIDWDNSTFFLATEEHLYHAKPIDREEFKKSMEHISGLHVKNDWFAKGPDALKRTWEMGYKDGFKRGVECRFTETQSRVPDDL